MKSLIERGWVCGFSVGRDPGTGPRAPVQAKEASHALASGRVETAGVCFVGVQSGFPTGVAHRERRGPDRRPAVRAGPARLNSCTLYINIEHAASCPKYDSHLPAVHVSSSEPRVISAGRPGKPLAPPLKGVLVKVASLLFFGFTAACLPIHPHPPNPAHVTYTYHASGIDRPGG